MSDHEATDGAARINPIAERSQRMLIAALIELMAERPYAEITITEISDRAGLSRRTFYRNFTAKEELLEAHTRELMLEYVDAVRAVVARPIDEVVLVHLRFWTRHLDFLRTLTDHGMGYLVLEKYNEFIAEAVRLTGSTRYAGSARPEYALAFNVGGHFNVLAEWLRRGCVDTPEQVASAFRAGGARGTVGPETGTSGTGAG